MNESNKIIDVLAPPGNVNYQNIFKTRYLIFDISLNILIKLKHQTIRYIIPTFVSL